MRCVLLSTEDLQHLSLTHRFNLQVLTSNGSMPNAISRCCKWDADSRHKNHWRYSTIVVCYYQLWTSSLKRTLHSTQCFWLYTPHTPLGGPTEYDSCPSKCRHLAWLARLALSLRAWFKPFFSWISMPIWIWLTTVQRRMTSAPLTNFKQNLSQLLCTPVIPLNWQRSPEGVANNISTWQSRHGDFALWNLNGTSSPWPMKKNCSKEAATAEKASTYNI